MDRLSRLGVAGRTEVPVGIMICGIPEVVNTLGRGPLWRQKEGCGPVGVKGKEVAARIELFILVIFSRGKDQLELDTVHEQRALFAHDRTPLHIRADEHVTEPRTVVFKGNRQIQIHID